MTKPQVEIYEKAPQDFASYVHIAACYIEIDRQLLLLQRAVGKLEEGKWGVPAGKLEKNETAYQAAQRELFEETGIALSHPSQIRYLKTLYIRKPSLDYVYHMFVVYLDTMPIVVLSDESPHYKWASEKEQDELSFMDAAYEALIHYRSSKRAKRVGASVNAYLILRQNNKILLQLRKNTGYCDGMWSLVAGHVEDGESATEGMIREAKEEIGITLTDSQIQVVHVMHSKTNRLNVDVFFNCLSWEGEIQNCEPKKCEQLDFFSLQNLPTNLIERNSMALKAIATGKIYSEYGWEE